VGSVTRCSKTFATHNIRKGVQHNNDDRFCLNGQRLILVSGSYGAADSVYRTEVDQFARITAIGDGSVDVNGGTSPTSWTVEYKNGGIAKFGGNATSRFKLPGTQSIHSWNLSRMLDRNGNYYEATYYTGQGSPKEINYTGNTQGGLATDKKVTFVYDETRSDVRTRYIVGRKITVNDRLIRIDVTKGSELVRQYNLSYQLSSASKRSRLISVEECGLNDACMPPIEIDWKADTTGFTTASQAGDKSPHVLYEHDERYNSDIDDDMTHEIKLGDWVDVNGDGKVDLVLAVKRPNDSIVRKTYVKVGNGWQEQSQWRLPYVLRNYDATIIDYSRFLGNVINQGQFTDVNGDGLVDVVYSVKHYTNKAQTTPYTLQKTYINNGNGWTESSAYAPKDLIYDYTANGVGDKNTETVRGRLIDINGDGLVDWLRAFNSARLGGEFKTTWINNGNGWSVNSAYKMPGIFTRHYSRYSLNRGDLVDVNGDGLRDWVEAYAQESIGSGSDTLVRQTWLNTGSGWQLDTAGTYALPDYQYRNTTIGWPTQYRTGVFVDLNGDGLVDWLKSHTRNTHNEYKGAWLNTGRGWVSSSGYYPPFLYLEQRYTQKHWPTNIQGFFIDVNQDGLTDYVQAYRSPLDAEYSNLHKKVWLNSGAAWLEQSSLEHHPNYIFFSYHGRENPKISYGNFVDINSDGSPDWVKTRAGQSIITRVSRLGKPDQLAKITTTMGVEVVPTFKPLTDNNNLYTKRPINSATGSALVAAPDAALIEAPIYVTSLLQTSSADGSGYNSLEYRYGGAQSHRRGRGFLGFQRFVVRDPQKDLVTITQYNQTFPFIGAVQRSVVEHNGEVISQTDNSYDTRNFASNSKVKLVYQDESTNETFELDANGGQQTRYTHTTRTVDDYGNVDVQTTQTGSNSTTILNTTAVDNDYNAPDLANWFVAQLDTSTTTFSGPGQTPMVRESKVTYDSLGRVATTIREPNGAANIKLTTAYTYDTYGNIETETLSSTEAGSQPRVNSIGYDADHRLPTSLTNALLQGSTIAYHAQCDLPETVTDINNQVTTYEYDDFCRETRVTSSIGTVATAAYNTSGLSCTDCQTNPALSITTHSQGEAPVTTYLNLFAQPMLTRTEGMLPTQTIEQRTEYDELGRATRASQPYFVGDALYWTESSYDDLDRTLLTTLPYQTASGNLATVQQSYSVDAGEQVQTTINTLGNVTTSYANALGQIAEVKDADNNSMTYGYDAQGNLIQTTDAANNSILVGYDVLGRRTSLNDPDLGLSTYTYNAFDEMSSQTDAKGQTITTVYDKLSRLTSRTVPDNTTDPDPANWTYATSTWSYDTAQYGVGSLASTTGPNGYNKTYAYDTFGRYAADATTIKGEVFTQAVTYDQDGFLDSRRYPDSGDSSKVFAIKYNYLNGYLSSITGVEDQHGNCIEHWRADEYDALGRTKTDTLGKLVTTTRTYDQGQGVLNKIESILQVNDQRTVQDLTYTYDANNNLKSRIDAFTTNAGTPTTVTETFDYDVLDRLTKHTNGGDVVDVTYDAIGNILTKSDVGGYSYGAGAGAGPHAVTYVASAPGTANPLAKFQVDWEWEGETITQAQPAIHDVTYQYDANGNITSQGNRNVTWTAFDKPESMVLVDQNGVQRGSRIEYDAEFQRIYKQEGEFDALGNLQTVKETSFYIGKDYERITDATGAIKHRYIISTGGSTVQIEREDGSTTDKPSYLLGDNQGSTHVVLNAQGDVEQRLTFDPWGMRTAGADPTTVDAITNKGYTGHEMDDEVGLINMNARIYDPYLGRFLSADPVLPDAGDMQAFNRVCVCY